MSQDNAFFSLGATDVAFDQQRPFYQSTYIKFITGHK